MSYGYSILENCMKKREKLFKPEYLFSDYQTQERKKWNLYERVISEMLKDKIHNRTILNNQRLLNLSYDVIYTPEIIESENFHKYFKFELLEAFALNQEPLANKIYYKLQEKGENSKEYKEFIQNCDIPQKLFMRNLTEKEYDLTMLKYN